MSSDNAWKYTNIPSPQDPRPAGSPRLAAITGEQLEQALKALDRIAAALEVLAGDVTRRAQAEEAERREVVTSGYRAAKELLADVQERHARFAERANQAAEDGRRLSTEEFAYQLDRAAEITRLRARILEAEAANPWLTEEAKP